MIWQLSIRSSNGSRTWRYLITYKNMLRAVENLGIEIAFGIIFIGNGELSKENYVKYIERHRKIVFFRNVLTIDIFKFRITREYLFQSEAFLQRMRDKMNTIRSSEAFIQYNRRYENLLKEKFIAEANRTKQINFYFLNTYDIVVMLRQVRYRKGSFRNGWK